MYFLYMKIINIDYKEDVFLALESAEITKATYIEARNLEKSLEDEFSLFTGFFKTDEDKDKEAIIVTALIDTKEQMEEFTGTLEGSGLDIRNEPIIRYVLLPVAEAFDPNIE